MRLMKEAVDGCGDNDRKLPFHDNSFAVALLVQLTVYGVVDAEYVTVRHHFVHDHFYPNRCGVVGFNCCAGKEECKSSNNTQGLCVQHRTTDGHCYTRKCVPKCQYGYVCTNTNLCMKINQTNDEYEQVDF